MKRDKKARLERAGWVVGDAAQFLKLSAQEQRFVELKLALATGVRQLRERRGFRVCRARRPPGVGCALSRVT